MRIITGIAKGKKLKAPIGMNTRPTADRVKESLFNIINDKCFEADVLDLFAGTGNLGLEALSRYAKRCVFVEQDKDTLKILKENIKELKFSDKGEVLNKEALNALDILATSGVKFDIIFLDPPYGKGLIEKSIEKINKHNILKSNGIIVSEYDQTDEMPEKIGNLIIYRTQKYGRTKISFWTKEENYD